MKTRLLILADDFTGALDTGVQFSKKGISTVVYANENVNPDYDRAEVCVMNLNSRHSRPEDAFRKAFDAVRKTLERGDCFVYKKTDSTLRGNIGAELMAVISAMGLENLDFIPAFPKLGRTTSGGIQYINGKKLEDSEFAYDPMDPSDTSSVLDIVAKQMSADPERVVIHDAETDQDLMDLAGLFRKEGGRRAFAGCAGFAEYMDRIIDFEKNTEAVFCRRGKLLLVCGSLNRNSLEQVRTAKEAGIPVFEFSDPDIISGTEGELNENGKCIAVWKPHISVTRRIMEDTQADALCVFGGDTLHTLMEEMEINELIPSGEIMPGVVCSTAFFEGREISLISKAGGFGDRDTALNIFKEVLA